MHQFRAKRGPQKEISHLAAQTTTTRGAQPRVFKVLQTKDVAYVPRPETGGKGKTLQKKNIIQS